MALFVFAMTIKDGEHARLAQLNERYDEAMRRAAAGVGGLRGIEKWVLGDQYVERIELDEAVTDFAGFSRAFGADPEVRQFLREVNGCFVGGLREMPNREMACLQSLEGEA